MATKKTKKMVKTDKGWKPEPDYCANCGSTEAMSQHRASVNGVDGIPMWLCDECGHAHLPKKAEGYNTKLDPDEQITMEEEIAFTLHDAVVNEHLENDEDCAFWGRELLKMVLKKFRPDLFTK